MLTQLLTDLLAAVETAATCEDLARSLVDHVPSVIPCMAATFDEVDDLGMLLISVSTDPRRARADAAADRLAWAREHPVLRDRAADDPPAAISDVMPRDVYRRSAVYREFHRELGVEDQLVVMVPGVALLIDRDGWGFSPGDHEQAAEIGRMIGTVRRVRLARDRARASAAVSARLNEDAGRVVLLADGAGGTLRTLDGSRAELAEGLRTSINAAVAVARLQLGNDDDGQPLVEIRQRATTGPELRVRVLRPCSGGSALPVVMERARGAVAADELRKYNLTDRQAEVMALLVDGATNGRVALELGISERTVEKHVVGAYGRLGVRCRTEALMKLLGS